MVISPVSGVAAIYAAQLTQNQASIGKQASPSEASDTVTISAAARAELGGADADGDGDGH